MTLSISPLPASQRILTSWSSISKGNYLGFLGANNFSTDEPIEAIDLAAGSYRLAIVRTGKGSHLATRLRYVTFPSPDGDVTGDYITASQPVVFGHAASRNAQAVAAYVYDDGSHALGFHPQPGILLQPRTCHHRV